LKFHVATNTGLDSENYGPFEVESVDLLKLAGDDFERGKRLLPLTVAPVVLGPKTKPAYVPFLGRFLFVLKAKARKEEVEFFADAIMTDVQVAGWGDYYVFHCPSIERQFTECLNLDRSAFELVRRSTMTLSPSTPWSVIEHINDVSSLRELFARKRRPALEVLVISRAQLKRWWTGSIFVFDGRVYFSSELLL
jgi:hypothetical protein